MIIVLYDGQEVDASPGRVQHLTHCQNLLCFKLVQAHPPGVRSGRTRQFCSTKCGRKSSTERRQRRMEELN